MDVADSQGIIQQKVLNHHIRLWKIMMQKATLFGGSVVVGPHDLNDQYHFTTSLLFPKIEKE